MNFIENRKSINQVNGNVMAWLSDRQIENEYEEGLRKLVRTCEKCGVSESYFKEVLVNVQLIDGICPACMEEK